MTLYYLLAIIVPILTAFGQIEVKLASKNSFGVFSKHNMIGALLFLLCIPISLFVLTKLDFSVFYSFSALTYICISVLSGMFLKEKMDLQKTIGTVVIVIGVIIYNAF